jgi:hypothetical protein
MTVPEAMQALHALGASADKPALAALVISIAPINVWNRLNVATRQVVGSGPRWEG